MFQRLSFSAKLLGMSITLSVLMIGLGCVSYFSDQKIQSQYDFVIQKTVPKLQYVNEMFLEFRQARLSLRTLGLAGLSKAEGEKAIEDVKAAIQKYEELGAAYVALGFIPGQKELYERTNATWKEFHEIVDQVLAFSRSGTSEDQKKMLSVFLNACPEKAKTFSAAMADLALFHKKVLAIRLNQRCKLRKIRA